MRRYTFLIISLMAIVFTSCEGFETPETLKAGESQLVVYAFPSDSDEYTLNISVTQPSFGNITEPQLKEVRCWTNDTEDEVTYVQTETLYFLPTNIYKVRGKHSPGDRIRISVKDARLPDVTAETTIPRRTEIEVTEAYPTEVNARMMFKMNFTDPAKTKDYYAVRVLETKRDSHLHEDFDWDYEGARPDTNKIYHQDNEYYWGDVFTLRNYCTIFTEYEPLLSRYNDMNLDAWNEYYDYMYCFSDEDIQHPKVEMNLVAQRMNYGKKDYTLEFYTLTPEYFNLLQSLNDQLSNEFGNSGFTQTSVTFNNVHGGFGCVAGYTVCIYESNVTVEE